MSQTPDQAEEFNVYSYLKQLIDGNDVSVLLRVADEVVSVMDTVSFFVPASYLTTVKNVSNGMKLTLSLIRKYLPEGALSRIYLDEQPKDSGKYVAEAIALESSDINAAGFAMFKIKPKTENVSLSWAAQCRISGTGGVFMKKSVCRTLPARKMRRNASRCKQKADFYRTCRLFCTKELSLF